METITKIKRKSDNKVFSCYFRNGPVKETTKTNNYSYSHWISECPTGEELKMAGVDVNLFWILETQPAD